MATEVAKSNKSYYIHSIIFVLITFGVWFIPPFGGITEMGMKVLGVFIGLLYGWIFIGFIWPSFFGMIALGLTGYATILEVFQSGMGNDTVLKVFFIFIFAGVLQSTNLTVYIAEWCISRKICRGRPWLLVGVIFLAAILVGGLINQYASIVIIWSIFYGICQSVGLKKGDPLVNYVVVGVPIMSTMGAMMLPFLPVSIIFRSMLQETILTTYEAPMGSLIASHLLLTVTLIIGYLLLGRFVLRINTDKLHDLDEAFYARIEGKKMTREQKISMVTLVAFILILVLPIVLPDSGFTAVLSNLDLVGAAVLMIIFFTFRRSAEGKHIYDFNKMVFNGINWDIVILFAATMPVSAAMESDETGIVNAIVSAVLPVFENISSSMYLVICFLVFLVITQVAHNLILGIVFTSVLASIGIDMGINPYLFQIFFAWALQLAFMTPGASANSALIFANTNWITTKDAYKYTTVAVICGAIMALCMLPVLMMLF